MFPFAWIQDPRWRSEAASVVVLELNTEVIQPAISVQPAWNNCKGIIRGRKEGATLVEDHTQEILDEAGNLVDLGEKEARIFGGEEIRSQVWTAAEHLERYLKKHPKERVWAWGGNGNL